MTSPDLLPEPLFLRALRLERLRAERSRRPFILMLIQPGGTAHNGTGASLLRKAAASLVPAIRETDVSGWHTQDAVLGVIFVEPGSTDRTVAVTALQRKMTDALQADLSPAELGGLEVSFHCFPEDLEPEARFSAVSALYPDLVQDHDTRRFSRAVKRTIDLVGSSLALIVLSPLLLAIAIAIRLTSPGPVLFRQTRIGHNGIPFTFLKFRSMHAANDPQIHREYVTRLITGRADACLSDTNGRATYKIPHDPRVTRLGRLLRRTSLDELPQLFNVLGGTMSLVGPRPPIAYEVAAYAPWHRRRLLHMKPGITGLWQVSGRCRRSFDDMVRLDLRYASEWSAGLDIKILLQTPRAVISGEGAY